MGPILAMEIFKEFPHESSVESLKNFKEWWLKAHNQVCYLTFDCINDLIFYSPLNKFHYTYITLFL